MREAALPIKFLFVLCAVEKGCPANSRRSHNNNSDDDDDDDDDNFDKFTACWPKKSTCDVIVQSFS